MLKYFKKQKGRLNSTNENDDQHYKNNNNDVVDQVDSCFDGGGSGMLGGGVVVTPEEMTEAAAAKRHSLRSTSSFCDEVFLEELTNMGLTSMYTSAAAGGSNYCLGTGGGGGISDSDDALSYGALSLGALSSCNNSIAGGASSLTTHNTTITAVNSIVGFDEDLFKCHSRLSMTLTSIVNEPNCLSYFVQYLDKKNALSFIKFYLDTKNFKNAALAQLRKELKIKMIAQQIPEEGENDVTTVISPSSSNDTDDDQIQSKAGGNDGCGGGNGRRHINDKRNGTADNHVDDIEEGEEDDITDNSHVPELKTLCDLTMRKPLTDDEKSQIYAETNKHFFKSSSDRQKLKASSELSLCSLMSNLSEISENAIISVASVKDALAIYKKYLIQDAKQRIELPVDILSKISLIICKKETTEDETATSITADCFLEAQEYVFNKLEKEYLNDYLQSTYYAKYCVDLIEQQCLNVNDILHSEVTLFYFMEYLEQHKERDCLDFWSTAINYRKSYLSHDAGYLNEKEAQSDAMIIYEKFFSLQNESKLWSSNKLRAHVESCICTDGMVYHCFDLPLKVAAKYLERKYLKSFLKSSLFSNYMNELKSKIQEDTETTKDGTGKLPSKIVLRRCVSEKTTNRHRKTLSDCTLDQKKIPISQQNTLLASMDNHYSSSQSNYHAHQHHGLSTSSSTSNLKQFQLNIDSSQLTNPDLLWRRSNCNNLKFGRVNSLGRYERDFESPADALHKTPHNATSNWPLAAAISGGNRLKNAMRKLVNLPEDNVQEEIAWQVAEMIVKDVTSVTMRGGGAGAVNQEQKPSNTKSSNMRY
ncbi:A-kinase anchoring protein pkaap [Musca autumnalis]|uniref:A-kinase anchoring protein pkaap n=1 Tax=Musca autumnalis TaxID=221902 RepID=UPI003CE75894